MSKTETRDLLILGGGLVGMTLALAAARAGMTVHVVERGDPAELARRVRTAAPLQSRPRAGTCSAISALPMRSSRWAAR